MLSIQTLSTTTDTVNNKLEVFTKTHLEFLMEHGYVVIPNVVTPEECSEATKDLLKVIDIWDPSGKELPAGTIHGINRLCAHTQSQWDMRQHPRVVQAFTDYWNSRSSIKYLPEEMVTSMDAFNLIKASSVKRASNCWGHTDQGRDLKAALDGKCVQGLVNLIDCTGDNDGGLVVWDKGHRAWRGYYEHHPTAKSEGNWHRYPDEFLKQIEKNGRKYLAKEDPLAKTSDPVPMERVRVRAPAGALVLWFSATPHQNDAPFQRNKSKPIGNDRAAVYVCMCPKVYLTPSDTKKRKKAFEENRQSSHFPAGGQVKIFGLSFQTYDKEKYQVQKKKIAEFRAHPYIAKKPRLTKLGKSVLGV